MGEHTLGVVEESHLLPVVVTRDDSVSAWAAELGIPVVEDPGDGLSSAATAGVEWAVDTRSSWVVLHVDLPLLNREDLTPVRRALKQGREIIAPSSDGGTSLIAAARPISFSYGPGSFSRHLPRLDNPVVLAATGLLQDLDSPGDLNAVLAHRRGQWLAHYTASP